jgi:hypothetical protein
MLSNNSAPNGLKSVVEPSLLNIERHNWRVRALHSAFVHVSSPVSCVSLFEVKRKID